MATVATEQVQEFLDDADSLVINVLDPEDFDRGHIPDSMNMRMGRSVFQSSRTDSREHWSHRSSRLCRTTATSQEREERKHEDKFDGEKGQRTLGAEGEDGTEVPRERTDSRHAVVGGGAGR